MNRDWMVTGRRPSGLCGAAILISARMNGFQRSTQEITKVVHVCDETIKKRLKEFSKTRIARMTKKEFEEFDISSYYPTMDPPAFTRNREKEKNLKIVDEIKEIETIFEEPNDQIQKDSVKVNESEVREMFEDARYFLSQANKEIEQDPFVEDQINEEEEVTEQPESKVTLKEDILSTLDDKDVHFYIHTNDEYNVKKTIWNIMFKEWVDEQKDKQLEKEVAVKKTKSRKMSKVSDIQKKSKTPFEAIKNSMKFGRRLNYNQVRRLFPNKLK